jgi:hypothetical protein
MYGDVFMVNTEKILGDKELRSSIENILRADVDEKQIRKIERKLKCYKEDMEYGNVYQMDLIDKIFCKLLKCNLFTIGEIFSMVYNLKFEYTIVVYYKMGMVNQLLNNGKMRNEIIKKYGGFKWNKK